MAVLTSKTIVTTVNGTSNATFTDPVEITIGGITISNSSFSADGVSNLESDESALAFVNAINSFSGETKVNAFALANVVTLTYAGGTDISMDETVKINGVAIAAADYTSDDSGATDLVQAINDISTRTGVTATVDTSNNNIVLTAADGRNIDTTVSGTLSVAGVTKKVGFAVTGISTANHSAVSLYRGAFRLTSDSTFSLGGTSASDLVSATTSVSVTTTNFTLSDVNIGSASNAQTAVFILDNVIRQLQTRRADVGSKSIRLDTAISELNTRQENLSSAESAIRDTDVAAETANLTSKQILQQAGVAVLTRANAIPQIALSLLQG